MVKKEDVCYQCGKNNGGKKSQIPLFWIPEAGRQSLGNYKAKKLSMEVESRTVKTD